MSYSYPTHDHAPRVTDDDMDDARAIVDAELRALTGHGCLLTMDVGDVDDIRARHLDPFRPTTDHAGDRYVAPDPWSTPGAYQSVVKIGRNKRGTTRAVQRAGRAPVVGSDRWVHGRESSGTLPIDPSSRDLLRGVRRLAGGAVDGDELAALTDRLYHGQIPALIGRETWDWKEAVPMSDGKLETRIDRWRNVGLSGGIHPRVDSMVGREYRTSDDDPRHYPTSWMTGGTRTTWPARLRLSMPRPRRGEQRTSRVFVGHVDAPPSIHSEHLAPHDRIVVRWVGDDGCEHWQYGPATHAWMGHRLYVRPASRRARTLARKRATRHVVLRVNVPMERAIAPVLEALTPGTRVTWEHGASRGTASMSATGRLNVRCGDTIGNRGHVAAGGWVIRSGRSVRGVVRAIAATMARTGA